MYVITVDPDMYRPTMAELTATATELLAIAMHNRMPLPHYVTIDAWVSPPSVERSS